MEIRRKLGMGAIGVALLVSSVGCGAILDRAAEKGVERGVEKALERSGECEDVDISQGGISASCGDESFDMSSGEGTDLPDGWPGELALPDGATVHLATSNSGRLSIIGSAPGDIEDLADGITAQLEGEGFTVEDRSTSSSGDHSSISFRAVGDVHVAVVSLSTGTGADEGQVSLSYSLQPVEEG